MRRALVLGLWLALGGCHRKPPVTYFDFSARTDVPEETAATPRIGVDYAGDWKDAPLRFCLRGSRHVSGKGPRRFGRKGQIYPT